MTAIQKTISISTLAFVAVFFHVVFCNWETGEYYRLIAETQKNRLVIPLGSLAGIYARSPVSHPVDAVFGVAFPVMFFGIGLFILAGSHRNDPIQQQPQ